MITRFSALAAVVPATSAPARDRSDVPTGPGVEPIRAACAAKQVTANISVLHQRLAGDQATADTQACSRYAQSRLERLEARLAKEQG